MMFIDQLKKDIRKNGVFHWFADPAFLYIVETLIKRAPDRAKTTLQFENFFRETLTGARVETLDRAGYDALLAQPPTTTAQEMHARWLEFSEPLPGLEQWKGGLVAPMLEPRKVFGSTGDNTRPPSVCFLLLFGEHHTYSVSAIETDRGRLDSRRIVPHDVSQQAVISGTSKAEKQQDINSITPLWHIAIALEVQSSQGGLSA